MARTDFTPVIERSSGSPARVVLRGEWTLRHLSAEAARLRAELQSLGGEVAWDLSQVTRLDSFGATLLWRAWGQKWPAQLTVSDDLRQLISTLESAMARPAPPPIRFGLREAVEALGWMVLGFWGHALDFCRLTGQLLLDLGYLLVHPREWPVKEFSANLFKVGVKAMPVTALVGFLIGVVLSYLSALQLKSFGADVFIVNILGLGIIRELGPVLVSVLVAGRSGSAMTAQLGVMRVTEEIDALAAMGISRTIRLVLPKVLALSLAMPLLVLWTSSMALLGGMMSAWLQLDLSFVYFMSALPDAVPVANLFIALSKGVVFGVLIALIACHFGLRVRPNTESLSTNTTASVVSAITMVILVDAIFAIATRSIGIP